MAEVKNSAPAPLEEASNDRNESALTAATPLDDNSNHHQTMDRLVSTGDNKDDEAATEGTDGSVGGDMDDDKQSTAIIVSSSKKSRPPYKYNPNKITLRFLFANRDGLTVTVECDPTDTVGQAKGALLSVWPQDLPDCSGADRIRLVCMGKGYLMPDSRTLEDCQIPVFKTHPTPINVTIKPEEAGDDAASNKNQKGGKDVPEGGDVPANISPTSQGCGGCTIL